MPDLLAQPVEESTATPTISPTTTTVKPTQSVSVAPSQPPAPTQEGPAAVAVDPSILKDLVDGVNTLNTVIEGDPSTSAPAGPVVLDDMQFGALGIGLALVIALLGALLIATVRR